MNDLTTRSTTQYRGSSTAEMTIELAKMLALVAPSSMTSEQQEIWLRAAVDSLEDIRADEVRMISAEVRRAVTRHNQIVPEISKRVAERRKEAGEAARRATLPAQSPEPQRQPGPPLTASEIERMPKWLKEVGLRVGFLVKRDGKFVEAFGATSLN